MDAATASASANESRPRRGRRRRGRHAQAGHEQSGGPSGDRSAPPWRREANSGPRLHAGGSPTRGGKGGHGGDRNEERGAGAIVTRRIASCRRGDELLETLAGFAAATRQANLKQKHVIARTLRLFPELFSVRTTVEGGAATVRVIDDAPRRRLRGRLGD